MNPTHRTLRLRIPTATPPHRTWLVLVPWTLLWLLLLGPAGPVRAEGGFGGLAATELQLQAPPAVRRVELDLALSLSTIRAQEVYRNSGSEPVHGELSLVLPPISLAELAEDLPFALPREQLVRDNPLDFTATVAGRPVTAAIQRRAIRAPRHQSPAAAGQADPGADVSSTLVQLGIPLTLDATAVVTVLERLPRAGREQLQALGLADFAEDGTPVPRWFLVVRYHWAQVFPPGQDLQVTHQYQAAPPGELVSWPHPGSSAHQRRLLADTCVSPATRAALMRRLGPGRQGPSASTAFRLDYLFFAGNTPQPPMERFRLTIDQGAPTNILSLCAPGLQQTGPGTWSWQQRNFHPGRDLHLLLVTAPID